MPQQPAQISHHGRRIVAQLPPGDPYDAPPVYLQKPVLFTISFRGAPRPVHESTIELDGQPLLTPEAVNLEEAIADREINVSLRPRQIGAV